MIDKRVAEHYSWGEGCDGWHLVKTPDLSMIQERMPARTAEVRHHHHYARQFFFVLKGTAILELAGTVYRLLAEQGLEVPPGQDHQLTNPGPGDLEFLVVSWPPSHGDRILSDTPQEQP